MSQRNPMNERYTAEDRTGKTRKSAASAKPKAKAAASVRIEPTKKTPQQKKAEEKARRKQEAAKQRELDAKYYKPDTERYKKLRRAWWLCLIGAAVCTIVSFVFQASMPVWLAFGILMAAYALIILAFYIDFSKIKKERAAYQARMVALEEKEKKKAKAEAGRAASQGKKGAAAKAGVKDAAGAVEVSTPQDATEEQKSTKKGLFSGLRKSKPAESDGTEPEAASK